MYQEWIVEFAFPFWAIFLGYDVYKNARRNYKQVVGLVAGALGALGFYLLATERTLGITLVSRASLLFVGRYGDIGAFLITGLIVANILARIGNFPRFSRHSRKLSFALILVNVFTVVNNFYSDFVFSLITSVLVTTVVTRLVVGKFEIADLIDFY